MERARDQRAASQRGARPAHAPALALALRVATFLREQMVARRARSRACSTRARRSSSTARSTTTRSARRRSSSSPRRPATARGGTSAPRLLATVRARFVEERDGVVIFYLVARGRAAARASSRVASRWRDSVGRRARDQALLRLGLVAGDDERARARREVSRAAADRARPRSTRGPPRRCSVRSISICTRR